MPRILLSLLAALMLGGCATRETASDPRVIRVLLLGGQSNMQGLGKVAQLTPAQAEPLRDVRFWNGEAFEALDPRATPLSFRPGEFGPEIGLLRQLRKGGDDAPLAVIKHFVSGQGLDAGWDGDDWRGETPGPGRRTFHPGEGADDPNIGLHYQSWLARVRAGLDALRKEGLAPEVIGVVWVQGERDAIQPASARRYDANLLRLRERLAADLALPSPPAWAFARVLPAAAGMPRFAARAELLAAMDRVDDGNPRPLNPGVRGARTDGFGTLPDKVHFDTKGQLQLGAALADALVKAQDEGGM